MNKAGAGCEKAMLKWGGTNGRNGMPGLEQDNLQVCLSLLEEHRQMEALLEKLDGLLAGLPETLAETREMVERIAGEMDLHFACEEEVLFPEVSPYHPMDLMEAEHVELMALRDRILAFSRQPGPPDAEAVAGLRAAASQLVQELLDHIGREDAGIFPACERCLPPHKKRSVVEGMQALRQRHAASAPGRPPGGM